MKAPLSVTNLTAEEQAREALNDWPFANHLRIEKLASECRLKLRKRLDEVELGEETYE